MVMAKSFSFEHKNLKKLFREGVKLLHPDRGGDREKFIKFLNWYREISKVSVTPEKIDLYKNEPVSSSAIYKSISLSIRDVALGLRKRVMLPLREVDCPNCKGSGKDQKRSVATCSICSGEGILRLNSNGESLLQRCTFCGGQGFFYRDNCPHCMGKGKLREEQEVEITVPLGLKNGDLLFISRSVFETKWDFYLEVELEEHPFWRLENNNLIYELKIPFWEILLENFIEIETLEGKERIPTTLFTKGEPVILPRRGPFLPDDNLWKRGDLIIYLKPLFPESLSSKAKRYLEKFKKILLEEKNDGA